MNESVSTHIYKVLYDYGDSFPGVGFTIGIITVILVGIGLMYHAVKSQHIDGPGKHSRSRKGEQFIFGFILMAFASLVFGVTADTKGKDKVKAIMKKGQYNVTEGEIKNYSVKYAGKGNCYIGFDINGIHFNLSNNRINVHGCESDDIKDMGFKDGDQLRVSYYNEGENKIVRIEQPKG